ncbi:MAG: hypothetical protein IKJ35_04190 [Clostridia bacterium]|nr:hypothetical protein [Clostridia bacterium]
MTVSPKIDLGVFKKVDVKEYFAFRTRNGEYSFWFGWGNFQGKQRCEAVVEKTDLKTKQPCFVESCLIANKKQETLRDQLVEIPWSDKGDGDLPICDLCTNLNGNDVKYAFPWCGEEEYKRFVDAVLAAIHGKNCTFVTEEMKDSIKRMTTVKALKKTLEDCIQQVCEIDANGKIQLKKGLTIGDVLEFKTVASAINDILVVVQTCAFADQIGVAGIKDKIANPNANGFDVRYEEGTDRVLAELKATVPCSENKTAQKYGANQASSIAKDLKNLLGISDKAENAEIADVTSYQRYMVLIDVKGQDEAFKNLTKPDGYGSIKVVKVASDTPVSKYDEYGWK